jgi:hypothetical protein
MTEKLAELNDWVMRKYGKPRRKPSQLWDRPELKALSLTDYELTRWKKIRVNLAFHIEVDRHYFTVPYTLAHKTVNVRITSNMMEIFHKNVSVASYPRSLVPHRQKALPAHMPLARQEAAKCSGGRIRAWARSIGPSAVAGINAIIEARRTVEQLNIGKAIWRRMKF